VAPYRYFFGPLWLAVLLLLGYGLLLTGIFEKLSDSPFSQRRFGAVFWGLGLLAGPWTAIPEVEP
jgi:hypothetical protein